MVNIDPSVIEGEVRAPPSKSLAVRFLLASLFSEEIVTGLPEGGKGLASDVQVALEAILRLGVSMQWSKGKLHLCPPTSFPPFVEINAGGSASLLRMLAPMLAAAGVSARLKGDVSLSRRPITSLVRSLQAAGVKVRHNNYALPMEISGTMRKGDLVVFGGESSQQVTGFILAAALRGGGQVRIIDLPSGSYVELTRWALSQVGINVERSGESLSVGPPRAGRFAVEVGGDYLISSFYASASLLTRGKVKITGLYPLLNFFGDHSVVGVFSSLGARSEFSEGTWAVSGWEGDTKGEVLNVDFNSSPDMALSVSPLLAVTGGEMKGVSRLSLKESDRKRGIAEAFASMGLRVKIGHDSISFEGGRPKKGVFDPRGDHRLAMMASSLMAVSGGKLLDGYCVSKSDPDYWNSYAVLGGKIRWERDLS